MSARRYLPDSDQLPTYTGPGSEPAVPEGAHKFEVGDRVMIRLSGECGFECPDGCDWHLRLSHSATGTVSIQRFGIPPWVAPAIECLDDYLNSLHQHLMPRDTAWQSHNIIVKIDGSQRRQWFAAHELTPLDDEVGVDPGR